MRNCDMVRGGPGGFGSSAAGNWFSMPVFRMESIRVRIVGNARVSGGKVCVCVEG